MAFYDFPQDTLDSYTPNLEIPADFDAFWQETLHSARTYALDATFKAVDYGLRTVDTFDVSFSGYGGQRVKAWLLLPRQRVEPLACVVEYVGYGGGRGFPLDWLLYSSAGYAHFVMDSRGQGSGWLKGDTPDTSGGDSSPQHPGFMTRGILDPHTYYYRRLFTDAVRAVEAAATHPSVDPERMVATGVSQGGGVSLAVGALTPSLRAVMPDVPFLCHFERAVTLVDTLPYGEIRSYLSIHRDKKAAVRKTLGYFDGVHFAAKTAVAGFFSVALMDTVCPPSTVYAAYNHYAGRKDLRVYDYNGHEGGQSFQAIEKLEFLRDLFKLS